MQAMMGALLESLGNEPATPDGKGEAQPVEPETVEEAVESGICRVVG